MGDRPGEVSVRPELSGVGPVGDLAVVVAGVVAAPQEVLHCPGADGRDPEHAATVSPLADATKIMPELNGIGVLWLSEARCLGERSEMLVSGFR